jgi:transcriptional regulator with XRE-family HTH domain
MPNTRTWTTKGVPLKIALLERGLIQQEAANHLGMPLSTFNMKLRGERRFTPAEKAALCRLLGKSETDLFPSTNSASEQNTQRESEIRNAS